MAETDMFLKLDGIDGESRDAVHKGEIDITSWSWGAQNYASGFDKGTAGRVHDVVVSKFVDAATVALMKAAFSGRNISKAVITLRKAGEQPMEYLTMELSDVYVTSIDWQARTEAHDLPHEKVKLNFSTITTTYKPQKPDGSADAQVKAGWNVKKNQPT
jgi:type VI secretion system secreted protein Hcp